MKNEFQYLEEGLEENILQDAQRVTLNKTPNGKTSLLDGMYGFWFKVLTPIYNSLALYLSKCREKGTLPE